MKNLIQKTVIVLLLVTTVWFVYACIKSMQGMHEICQLALGLN